MTRLALLCIATLALVLTTSAAPCLDKGHEMTGGPDNGLEHMDHDIGNFESDDDLGDDSDIYSDELPGGLDPSELGNDVDEGYPEEDEFGPGGDDGFGPDDGFDRDYPEDGFDRDYPDDMGMDGMDPMDCMDGMDGLNRLDDSDHRRPKGSLINIETGYIGTGDISADGVGNDNINLDSLNLDGVLENLRVA